MAIQEVVSLGEIFQILVTYARGIWRHRWHMLGIAWFVCLPGWLYVYFMPDLYQVNARVAIIDPQKDLSMYMKSMNTNLDITAAARAVLDQLVNRDNLLQVLRETDLAEGVTDHKDLEFQMQRVRQSITILPQRGNTYLFSMKTGDPRLGYQVIQGLLNILMKGNTGSITSPTHKASNILEDQIADFQGKMMVAEKELREFRKKNIDILGEDDADFYQRYKSIQNQMEKESSKIKELEKRREEIMRQLSEQGVVESQPEASPETGMRAEELRSRLAELQGKYYMKGNVKRPLYGEDHPEVVALRRMIELFEEQKKKGLTTPPRETKKFEESHREKEDPFVAKLKMNLSDVDMEYASLQTRVAEMEKRLQSMKLLESSLPSVMSDLEHLKKKVAILKEKLTSLMNTQGEATFTGDLAANLSKLVTFEIAEKPAIPTRTIGPNRPLFMSLVFAGGVLAGLVTALILAYARPVFDSPMHLKQVLGLPVLGTVSMIQEPGFMFGMLPRSSFYWLLVVLVAVYGLILIYSF